MTEVPRTDRPRIIEAGLVAAGVPASRVALFADITDEIIMTESRWHLDAHAAAGSSLFRGPAALFGKDVERILPDGYTYATPRGVAQLTPRIFELYRAAGMSGDIYDPTASIAALWRFISDQFAVDLHTGTGVADFHERWYDHRQDWWWLTELAPISSTPRIPGY
ncbi:hypothetical protein [Mycobacteroides abscessus]|uniref:hypothetical protein n=1 Tax=Mycobacteroides abscessus TaxID=36809 RepID=UPI00266C7F39|nr:hypothetical protein [Mycobacteroides abscessus]MDO3331327.1 hypothetical protein [Mycobacteroides abscessus subsp. abscessus]